MFYGIFHHRLNSKNQVTVPLRFREAVDEAQEGKGLFLFMAEKECLYLLTPKAMDEVAERARAHGGKKGFMRVFYCFFHTLLRRIAHSHQSKEDDIFFNIFHHVILSVIPQFPIGKCQDSHCLFGILSVQLI